MSIALFTESVTEAGKAQTLLVPTDTTVLMFHRLSTGQRGRGNAWQIITDLDTLPSDKITSLPNGVILSGRDVANAEMGNVTSLSIKAIAMGEVQVSELEALSHYAMVAILKDGLEHGDNSLNQYVRDGRRSNPVMLKPIQALTPAYFPVLAPAENETVAEPTKPVTQTTSAKNRVELAQVPDKKWADLYLNRKITKEGKTDFDILDVAMAENQNVLIRGHAGSGKTVCVMAYASARGLRYYNVSSNVGLEPSHLFGAWTPTDQAGVFRWQDGAVTDLVRNGGVLLLNEIDFMPERISTVLFSLLDDRREIQLLENGGEVIKAHPDLLIVGDHNPNYRGSRPMNQAWKDRFAHKLEFEYDHAIERKLIKNASLLEVANKLREQNYKGEIDTPISTRGLMAFVKNVENLGLDYAVTSYVNGFLDDEREAVKLVMDTAKHGIAQDFGIATPVATQIDEA